MTVAAILQSKGGEVLTAQAGQNVADVVKLLAERRIGALTVLDGETVIGVISERDVIYGLADEGHTILDKRVDQIMTAPAVTIGPEHSALNALALITRRRIRHLPVVEGGRLIGIVSIGDLVKRRIDGIESEANALREYIRGI